MVSVVKMATVFEDYTPEEHRPVVRFLCAKGLNEKGINKEMFPVYGGKCLSLKVVYDWVAIVSLMTKRLERLTQQSKECCAAGFDGTSVSMLVEDMSGNNFFFRF
jgi:hypothetical protein